MSETPDIQRMTNFEAFFDSIDEGACVIRVSFNADGQACDWHFLHMNSAFISQTGMDPAGRSMREIVPDHEQRWFDIYGDVAKTGEPVRFVQEAAQLGRWFDLYAFRIGEPGEDLVGVIFKDITIQHRIQRELLETRDAAEAANLAKSEFLANMSHEIRTPMNAIIGLSTILSGTTPLTPKQKEYITTLQLSADSLLSLINDLLDISKIEARTVELERIPFSLSRLMQEVTSMMAVRVREKKLDFRLNSAAVEDMEFIGDPTRLRQIILNLCSNAIKFTETGGVTITVDMKREPGQDIAHVTIGVTDSGVGIAREKIDTIFHKFVQADASINRKYGGTGLGLAITKTLVEIMGGTIRVNSRAGEGSTFTVVLPLVIGQADKGEISADEENLRKPHRSDAPLVLLVEDYEPNILVAETILDRFGYMVDVARNGLEAVDKFKRGSYAAVLMDVQMYGMNGFDATHILRRHEKAQARPPTPIIGMTAHALSGDRERCLAAGMDDYISKPFNPDDLNMRIARLVKAAA